jgi:predicted Fe-Mo cluster-binding NifX family protein
MKLALSIWQSRVSPVFDTAGRLLVVEVQDGREVARTEETIGSLFLPRKVQQLCELGVEVLICGAISRPLACLVAQSGIALVPWIAGNVEEVLRGYLDGRLPDPRFLMPGGGHCRRRRGGRHRRHFERAMPGSQAFPHPMPLWMSFADSRKVPEQRLNSETEQNTIDS